MVVCRVEAVLGLDRGAVDPIVVQALPDLPGEIHILVTAGRRDGEVHLDVQRGNEACVVQLPDVNVVAADYALQVLDVFPDLLEIDVLGCRLEQDLGSRKGKRDGRAEDDHGDEERDGRIGVEASRPVREPDNQGCGNDSHVTQSISNDVKNHGVHAHVSMVMSVSTLACLLRLGVVVLAVNVRVPSPLLWRR